MLRPSSGSNNSGSIWSRGTPTSSGRTAASQNPGPALDGRSPDRTRHRSHRGTAGAGLGRMPGDHARKAAGRRAAKALVREAEADACPRPVCALDEGKAPQAGHPPDDAFAGSVLPGDRRELQAVPSRRRSSDPLPPRAARVAADVLRGGPDHDRPLSRRGEPVCHAPSPRKPSTRPHTTSRSSRWKRPRGRSWSTSRSPSSRLRGRPSRVARRDAVAKTCIARDFGSAPAPDPATATIGRLGRPRAKGRGLDEGRRRRQDVLVPVDRRYRFQAGRDPRIVHHHSGLVGRHPEKPVKFLPAATRWRLAMILRTRLDVGKRCQATLPGRARASYDALTSRMANLSGPCISGELSNAVGSLVRDRPISRESVWQSVVERVAKRRQNVIAQRRATIAANVATATESIALDSSGATWKTSSARATNRSMNTTKCGRDGSPARRHFLRSRTVWTGRCG